MEKEKTKYIFRGSGTYIFIVVASINKFSNDRSFMQKISNLESKNEDVSTSTTADKRDDTDQKLLERRVRPKH